MVLRMEGQSGIRLTTNDGDFTFGQVEVTAMVAGASGVVSAFYVSMFARAQLQRGPFPLRTTRLW
jgi:hypothetical protein